MQTSLNFTHVKAFSMPRGETGPRIADKEGVITDLLAGAENSK